MRLLQDENRYHRRFGVMVLLTLLPTLGTAAEIYRWVDENGVVNFTQQVPRGVDAELVGKTSRQPRARVAEDAVTPPAASGSQTSELTTAGGSDELSPAQQQLLDDLKVQEANRQAELVQAKATNCERARQVLTNLTKIGRVRVVAQDGTQSVMPEEERQRRISEAQESIAVNCAG